MSKLGKPCISAAVAPLAWKCDETVLHHCKNGCANIILHSLKSDCSMLKWSSDLVATDLEHAVTPCHGNFRHTPSHSMRCRGVAEVMTLLGTRSENGRLVKIQPGLCFLYKS